MILSWLRERDREKIVSEPFSEDWRKTIENYVMATRALSSDEWASLEPMIQVFIAEKNFEGCAGLDVDETMRLVIAAQACLLIMNLEHDLYGDVDTILVYPTTYKVPEREQSVFDPGGDVHGQIRHHLGEAHHRGPIVLAWDAVLNGAYNPNDARNLVFHEFAHALDLRSGNADGTPPLDSKFERKAWHVALEPVYLHLQKLVDEGARTFLDPYGATNEAEFFAVATEYFFERPNALQGKYPDLYEMLQAFYLQDPASRT